MLKNRVKIITILFMVILLLSSTFAFAVQEEDMRTTNTSVTDENTDNGVMPISTNNETNDVMPISEDDTSSTQEMTNHDVFLTGDNVTVDKIIDGNLVVIGNNVTIDTQIGGDVLVFANNLTVTENGYVFSNLFVSADSVMIKGVVYDLFAMSKTVSIPGYIYRDARVSCDTLNLFGTVGRSVYANSASILFEMNSEDANATKGVVYGDLNYSSNSELSFPDKVVTGSINYTPKFSPSASSIAQQYITSILAVIISTIIVWLISLWIKPKFLEKTEYISSKKLLPVIGIGLLAAILMPILFVIFLVTGFTFSVSAIVLALYLLLMILAGFSFVILLNNLICSKLKITMVAAKLGMLVLLTGIIWALKLIPYVGTAISMIITVIGIGLILAPLFLKDKSTEEIATKKEKKEAKKQLKEKSKVEIKEETKPEENK